MEQEIKVSNRTLTILSIFAEQRSMRLDRTELAELVQKRLERNKEVTNSQDEIPNLLFISLSLDKELENREYFETDEEEWNFSPTSKGMVVGEEWLKKVRKEWDR